MAGYDHGKKVMNRLCFSPQVNYPNQWTGRSLQSMQFVTNDEVVNKADIMATFVMKQIDDFKEKYL